MYMNTNFQISMIHSSITNISLGGPGKLSASCKNSTQLTQIPQAVQAGPQHILAGFDVISLFSMVLTGEVFYLRS
jgi:hypothetical protein